MRKGIVKAVVLFLAFVISVVAFSFMTNRTNEDLTIEMTEATLPVITLYEGNTAINELHGYLTEMDAAFMRDTVTPIREDLLLPLKIKTYQMPVDAISYEIRSLDARHLIADAEVSDFKSKKGTIELTLQIQNLLDEGEEYLLVICLESGDKTVRYYTRIIEPVDCHVTECIEFVKDFNNKTFNKETVGTLGTYLERATGDNATLHYTTLNNSLNQVGWADFEAERLVMPIPSVKEITSSYNVIVLDYVITRTDGEGENTYYNVEEYYRIRYTSQRMYVLNFERTVNQIFRKESGSLYEKYIHLGIRSGEVEYLTDEAGEMTAFVQEGELWSYRRPEHTMVKVFSFRGYEGIDERENYGEHDIRIVSVDENGGIDYIVYGYMNRGLHEGEVGIAVYHYDSVSNTNEEKVFLPSSRSYEVMKSELGQLMFINEDGLFYIMVDGNIYEIDLNTLETNRLVEGLSDDAFAVSEHNRFFAWTDAGNEGYGSEIRIMDFVTGKVSSVKGSAGEYVKPLGFMEEDFVYGVLKASDVVTDAAGNITVPMYQVKIMNTSSKRQEILKTYEKQGYFVKDVVIDGSTMYLNRIRHNGTAYADADQDMIMNREGGNAKPVVVGTSSKTEKQREIQLILPEETGKKSPKLLTPKETILAEEREILLEDRSDRPRYYVYVKGDVILTTDHVTEAVLAANAGMGVVVGDGQQYIWKRARKTLQNAFNDIHVGEEDSEADSITQCINAMLEKEGINISVSALISQGDTPKEILNNALKEAEVLDLTGCSVEETLYYVSCGYPVFAMTGEKEAVLIIGYDTGGITVFAPSEGIPVRKTMTEADELFSDAGRIFFTYLKE